MDTASPARSHMAGSELDIYKNRIDEVSSQVNQLGQRVLELEQYYSDQNKKNMNSSKASSILKTKDKGRHIRSIKTQQEDAISREPDPSKRMQALLQQFGTILHQITQHKWAEPFMKPVDVEYFELHDYYEIIEKPMDFGTIKNRLEAKDDCGYKHVREACADVRLVMKNAMKYNEEKHDVHVMAKTLLAKFEEKWLQFLPKVVEEEKRLMEIETQTQLNRHLAHESAYAKMAKNTSDEILEMDMQLDDLREMVLQTCRKISTEEKRQLGTALTRLSADDLSKALDIVAQGNPSFLASASEVDLDIDAQSEATLWRLKFLVKSALQNQAKPSASTGANHTNKRKREICMALARNAKKSKKSGAP